MQEVSIVINSKNEDYTIINFIKRIDLTMKSHHIAYEIIVIDDHSTDLTQITIQRLSQLFPLKLYERKEGREKNILLLEGFYYSKFNNIAVIENKEYSPEIISRMLTKLYNGFDVVIAQNDKKIINKDKEWYKKMLLSFWGKKIHKLDTDFTSKLKICKKNVLKVMLSNHTNQIAFDLEFLIRVRNAGYKIANINISFEKYFVEKKINDYLQTAWNISSCAINLKFANADVRPFYGHALEEKAFSFKGKKFFHYSQISITDSAFFRLDGLQKKMFLILFITFLGSVLLNWQSTIIVIMATLTILYFSDLLFNLYLITQSLLNPSEINIKQADIDYERSWPKYTIFCPLYKESAVLQQFIEAIENLNYPKDKVQVILLLEDDDKETLEVINRVNLPQYLEIYILPHSLPKTKPKALNFGMQYAKGNYCVVYDAEDIPDPNQLKKVVLAFEKCGENTKCIQAKLNFYNPLQNLLTKIFTAEYSLWFDLILCGLQSTHSLIPLGGTSNHFRTKELKDMHCWDSFNVTEDCDLGLRLAKKGYETAIVNSTTLEEANSNIPNWFSQRGRWIKGYIQTYLVHIRNPRMFIKQAKIKQFIKFQLVIGGKIMSLFINPIMWFITLTYFSLRPFLGHFIEKFFPGPILYLGVFCLVFGNFLYLYYYMIGCAKKEKYNLIKYAFFVPFYWLAMSIASWIAVYKIITQPHYWAKTHHGFHLPTLRNDKNKTKNIFNTNFLKPQISI